MLITKGLDKPWNLGGVIEEDNPCQEMLRQGKPRHEFFSSARDGKPRLVKSSCQWSYLAVTALQIQHHLGSTLSSKELRTLGG